MYSLSEGIAPRLVQVTVQACVPLFGSRGSQLQLSQLQGEHMAAFSFCGTLLAAHLGSTRNKANTRSNRVDGKGQPRKFWNRRVGIITNWTTAIYKVCHGFFCGGGARRVVVQISSALKKVRRWEEASLSALFHTTSCDQAVDDYFILQ